MVEAEANGSVESAAHEVVLIDTENDGAGSFQTAIHERLGDRPAQASASLPSVDGDARESDGAPRGVCREPGGHDLAGAVVAQGCPLLADRVRGDPAGGVVTGHEVAGDGGIVIVRDGHVARDRSADELAGPDRQAVPSAQPAHAQ